MHDATRKPSGPKGYFSHHSPRMGGGETHAHGFTIVELLVVIIVIAILAAITIAAYNGITQRAVEASLESDLATLAKKLEITKINTGSYPNDTNDLQLANDTTYSYIGFTDTFCLTASRDLQPSVVFHVTSEGPVARGNCPLIPIAMQTINATNCLSSRMLGFDARDNHTYWVQRMPDSRCWMLTNLAYGGGTSNGGTSRYGDVKTINAAASPTEHSYSAPIFYAHASANATLRPAQPSTSTDGTGQLGYHYNWCAAMGAQIGTAACVVGLTPTANATISVCPAGWRLPTTSELSQLTADIGATNDAAGSLVLRTDWLAQYGGYWYNGLTESGSGPGAFGAYWSSTPYSETYSHWLFLTDSLMTSRIDRKFFGYSVRCIAT